MGALFWCWRTGWQQGWLALLLVGVITLVGVLADLLALGLSTARLQASCWAPLGAGLGLLLVVMGCCRRCRWAGHCWLPCSAPGWVRHSPRPGLGQSTSSDSWSGRGGVAGSEGGTGVVVGLLVSREAQALLAVFGVLDFALVTLL